MLNLKKTTAFIVIACLFTGFISQAQEVTLSRKNVPLTRLFTEIEKQTGYVFFFDPLLLRDANKVTIDIKKATLKEALDACFRNQPLTYFIAGPTITVKRVMPGNTERPTFISVKGTILTGDNEPVSGATIFVRSSNRQTAANDSGRFTLENIEPGASILVTSVNYESQEIKLTGQPEITIQLVKRVAHLSDVTVVSTGYQDIRRESITGSFTKIDNFLFNRRVSPTVLDRLEGVASGVLFNKNIVPNVNQSSISVRGRSTIYANPEPLIILDNFPYNGDINNINPNDIESITILKDAAASAIWGAYAGNGVIVITSKKGKYNQRVKVSFNSNVTAGNKPDLYYAPILSSSDYIDMEQFLFSQGYYNVFEPVQGRRALSPAVEIMIRKRDGLISTEEGDAQLNTLRNQDRRKSQEKYFYRTSLQQQYALNVNGGNENQQYYFSAGYDKGLSSLRNNGYSRVTLNASNTYLFINKRFELNTGVIFTSSNAQVNNSPNPILPYIQVADADGNALTTPLDLRQPYKDTAGRGLLLDWNYRPLDELRLADNSISNADYRVNINTRYKISKSLAASVAYQYNKGITEQQNYQSEQTYFTRNLINRFTQINGSTIIRPIPLGGIYDVTSNNYEASNVRAQLNYNRSWAGKHTLVAIAGTEIRKVDAQAIANRLFGYSRDQQSNIIPDYTADFPLYYFPTSVDKIPNKTFNRGTADRFISYYMNANYTWQQRYVLSASARKDESNIFGVKTNQKGVPLWSIGASWHINKERFYNLDWLPVLKLRVTNGYAGNVDRNTSAYTTAAIFGPNIYGAIASTITNPPNPALRWEKIGMTNLGLDFSAKNNVVTGSVDFYFRKGSDLLGNSSMDPTTGVTTFRGNTANMKGRGIDILINSININKKLKWYSSLIFNYANDKVSEFKFKPTTIATYFNFGIINALAGNPLYSVYSLKWQGLDTNGDPVGYLDGHTSKDYNAIINSTNFDNLKYEGPANPVFFGSLRNTFTWHQLEFSFVISWKAGYYFRRSSVIFNDLISGLFPGHPDFANRWKVAGDEKFTNVPSLRLPVDINRNYLYSYSEILIEKGDHIRLQDLQLSYDIGKRGLTKLHVQGLRLYLYANNIGIIWRANDKRIDPDFITGVTVPNPRTLAAGIKVDF